jgi:hypothetical protein
MVAAQQDTAKVAQRLQAWQQTVCVIFITFKSGQVW